jgi:hypothetical protein
MTYGHGYNITKQHYTFPDKSRNHYVITVSISNVKVLDHTHADLNIDIGELMRT